jgi:hypothetical protein
MINIVDFAAELNRNGFRDNKRNVDQPVSINDGFISAIKILPNDIAVTVEYQPSDDAPIIKAYKFSGEPDNHVKVFDID